MVDYKLKAQVLSTEFVQLYKYVSQSLFFHNFPNKDFQPFYNYSLAKKINSYFSLHFPEIWQECYKLNHAEYERYSRLKKYVDYLLRKGSCLFLTLTFNDFSLSSLSDKTRRTYVTRFLKSYSDEFVANKDFGGKFGREHYHAIILCNKVNFNDWKCGNLDFKRIGKNKSDYGAVSRYVAKATHHAIKDTTRRSALIYSRSAERKQKEFKLVTKQVSHLGKYNIVKPIDLPFDTPYIHQEKFDLDDELF